MMARFLYRLASLVFFAIALVCWLVTIIAVAMQLMVAGFNLGAFFAAIMMPIMAFTMPQ